MFGLRYGHLVEYIVHVRALFTLCMKKSKFLGHIMRSDFRFSWLRMCNG